MQTTPRVIIDLNSTDEDGETIVFLRDVSSGELEVGRIAIAYEPEDGVAAPARVASIHRDKGVAFLQVDWRAMKRERPESRTFRLNTAGWARNATSAASAQSAMLHARRTSPAIRFRSNASG